MNKMQKTRKGFTLVELLTVIAIIGILAAILIPTVGGVLEDAQRTGAGSNVREISKSHYAIAMAGAKTKKIGVDTGNVAGSTQDWAEDLASKGGINDPALYFAGAVENTVTEKAIWDTVGDARVWTAPSIVAYDVCIGVPSVVSGTTTTTLIWTTDVGGFVGGNSGKWTVGAPWTDKGGHVGFVDGHIEFLDNTTDAFGTYGSLGTAVSNPVTASPNGLGSAAVVTGGL